MKALNRAIARTVSQLGRYGREGCHPPMLMALETHLDALLTMERKQLEQVPGKLVAFSTPQEKNGTLWNSFIANCMMENDDFREYQVQVKPGLHIEPGDTLTRIGPSLRGRWTHGSEYPVLEKDVVGSVLTRCDDGLLRWMAQIAVRHHFSVCKKKTEFVAKPQPAPTLPGDELAASSMITGGRRPGRSGVAELIRTPVEEWTSDQLAWFKGAVLLSTSESEKLDARWNAARTQADAAVPCCGNYETCTKACVPRGAEIGRKQALGEADSKLQAAADAATKAVRDAVRYMNQRNRLRAVLLDVLDSLEYVEKSMPGQAGFMVRQERIARAKATITEIEGSHSSGSPVTWYQSAVQGVSDLSPQLAADGYVNATGGAMPAPDAIDMTDPRNWQVGDVLMCSVGNALLGFNHGDECTVTHKYNTHVVVRRDAGTAVAFQHDSCDRASALFFTWLRHGEAQQ